MSEVFIERIDRYTIEVDGQRVRATPGQEKLIRAMDDEARERFLIILGARA